MKVCGMTKLMDVIERIILRERLLIVDLEEVQSSK
jgi:hypothetical protein